MPVSSAQFFPSLSGRCLHVFYIVCLRVCVISFRFSLTIYSFWLHFFYLASFLSSFLFFICLGYRADRIVRRPHLGEHLIEPLQWPMQMYLNPTRCRCNILTMIFSTPTLYKGHAYCAHFRQLIDCFEPAVHRL